MRVAVLVEYQRRYRHSRDQPRGFAEGRLTEFNLGLCQRTVKSLSIYQTLGVPASATVNGRDGPANFSGVPVSTLLEKAGIAFGESPQRKTAGVMFAGGAADGYRVVIALPEVDPGFTDRPILLVDKRETHPLDDKEGPYRIVIPDEKRMAKWVRQVKTLKIVEVQ